MGPATLAVRPHDDFAFCGAVYTGSKLCKKPTAQIAWPFI
jgi:hypothetical protein